MFKEDPREGVDINVLGFMNVMESAKRNRAKKVIFASSSSMYNGLPIPFKESRQRHSMRHLFIVEKS
jgi:nucleoside-diphosphate-sugar epimerase